MDPITLALLYGGLQIAGSLGNMAIADANKANTLDQLGLQGIGLDRQINSQGKQIQAQYTQNLQDLNTQSANYQTSSAERGIGVGNSASQINMEQSVNRLDRWASQATSAVSDQATSARGNMFSQEQQAIVNNNQAQDQGMLNIGMTLVGTGLSVGNIATQMGQAAFNKTIYGQADKFLFQPTQKTMNIGGMDMPTTMPSRFDQFTGSIVSRVSKSINASFGSENINASFGKNAAAFKDIGTGSSFYADTYKNASYSTKMDRGMASAPKKIESSYDPLGPITGPLGPITGPLANSFDLSDLSNQLDAQKYMQSIPDNVIQKQRTGYKGLIEDYSGNTAPYITNKSQRLQWMGY